MRAFSRAIALCLMLGTVAAAQDPTPTLSDLFSRAEKLEPAQQAELGKSAVAAARKMANADVLDALAKAPVGACTVAAAVATDLLVRGGAADFTAPLQTETAQLAPVLAATGRPEAVDLLLPLLASKLSPVRRAAVRAIGDLAGFSDRIVPKLRELYRETKHEVEAKEILWAGVRLPGGLSCGWLAEVALGERLELLASVFDPGYRQDVLFQLVKGLPKSHAALIRLSGKNLGIDESEWKRLVGSWTPRSKPREGGVPKPPPKSEATFFGVTLPSGDLVFLIDVSRSMKDGYKGRPLIQVVKEKVIELLSGFGPDRRFNVVFFSDGARAYRPKMVPATKTEVARAIRFIRKAKPRGNTNLEAGLRAAIADPKVSDIALLSDGLPNRGFVRLPGWVVSLLGDRKVRIHTIGTKASAEFMKRVAELTGGRHGVL